MRIVAADARHAEAVSALALAEGWESWTVERTHRVLAAPGATAVVAVEDDEVAGVAHAISDGELAHYLALLVVAPAHRRRGIAGALVDALFDRLGVTRLDLLATEDSRGFYRSRPHREKSGFRLYARAEDAA